MRILYRGLHVHKGQLKLGIALYPDIGSKTYLSYPYSVDGEGLPLDFSQYRAWQKIHPYNQYVCIPVIGDKVFGGAEEDYYDWEDSLPHIWCLNPALLSSLTIPEYFQVNEIKEYLARKYDKDSWATIDNALVQPNSAHIISAYSKTRSKFTEKKIITKDIEDLINSRQDQLTDLSLDIGDNGAISPLTPGSIDVGVNPAVFGTLNYYWLGAITVITRDNPANDSGSIDTVQIFFKSGFDGTNVKAGSFYDAEANNRTCRDQDYLGDTITGGSTQTIEELDFNITAGDFIGTYFASGRLERNTVDYDNVDYFSGDSCIAEATEDYNPVAGDCASIYGTGGEVGGGLGIPIVMYHRQQMRRE